MMQLAGMKTLGNMYACGVGFVVNVNSVHSRDRIQGTTEFRGQYIEYFRVESYGPAGEALILRRRADYLRNSCPGIQQTVP